MHSLDVSAASAGPQDGAALQLNALHCLAVQHHRLLLTVVESLVPVPGRVHPGFVDVALVAYPESSMLATN